MTRHTLDQLLKITLQKITFTVKHRKLTVAEARKYPRGTFTGIDEAVVLGAGKPIRIGMVTGIDDQPGAYLEHVRLWALRELATRFGVSIAIRGTPKKRGIPK